MFLKSDKKRKFSIYVYKSPTDSERVNHSYETYQEAQKTKQEPYTEGAWLNRIYYKEKGYKKAIARYYSDLAGARIDSLEVEMSELEKSALSKEREKQIRKEMLMELSNELLDKINKK